MNTKVYYLCTYITYTICIPYLIIYTFRFFFSLLRNKNTLQLTFCNIFILKFLQFCCRNIRKYRNCDEGNENTL